MFKIKLLKQVLEQVLTRDPTSSLSGGVFCSMLLNTEGETLAVAGGPSNNSANIAGIVANIFSSFERDGFHSFGAADGQPCEEELDFLILECENGHIAVGHIGLFILCVCADASVPTGLLLRKVQLLCNHLEEPLSQMQVENRDAMI
eukprot:gnl/Spiro4/2762_TR1344_c1_g1_i1.p1 gnl/Spiro4/2762_TR1344_c1_g1~~gnl/Spiro4/2762_TR1344_c1_g1_i1.p1  ORF type:complete len:158 (+),score=37.30 gnl/Spiro4/2762_TR1344_c1_g1_i1:35-475(+)